MNADNKLNENDLSKVSGGTGEGQSNKLIFCAKCRKGTRWGYNAEGVWCCTECGGTEVGTATIVPGPLIDDQTPPANQTTQLPGTGRR